MIKLSPSPFQSDQWTDRLASFTRGVRRAFSRDNLIRNLKTILGVIPLTILVWVVAEQQEVVNGTGSVRIVLQSTDPAHRAVTLLRPSDGTVQLALSGSQTGIDHVRALLRQTLLAEPMEVDIGNSLPPGAQQPLSALDQIAANRLFASHGVTVTACSPDTLLVRVDSLEERIATVRPPQDAPGLVQATFHPPVVTMRGPITLLDELARTGPLTVTADLATDPALQTPGQHNHLTIPLVVPDNVTLIPATVTADLTVGQADQSLPVSPVPVKVLAPKYLTDNYKFDYKEVLTQPVTVTGPPQAIAQIDPRKAPLIAVVELDNNDAGHQLVKPIHFEDKGLPEGVHVKLEGPPPTIQISVDPR